MAVREDEKSFHALMVHQAVTKYTPNNQVPDVFGYNGTVRTYLCL